MKKDCRMKKFKTTKSVIVWLIAVILIITGLVIISSCTDDSNAAIEFDTDTFVTIEDLILHDRINNIIAAEKQYKQILNEIDGAIAAPGHAVCDQTDGRTLASSADSPTPLSKANAVLYCAGLSEDDTLPGMWRLPTMFELGCVAEGVDRNYWTRFSIVNTVQDTAGYNPEEQAFVRCVRQTFEGYPESFGTIDQNM